MSKKCRLVNIEPTSDNGVWSTDAIYYCIENIVDTQCHIDIIGQCDSNDVYPSRITDANGRSLNTLLISQGFAKSENTFASEEKFTSSDLNGSELSLKTAFNPEELCDVMDYEKLFESTKVAVSKEIDKQTAPLSFDEHWREQFELYNESQFDKDFPIDNCSISTSTSIYADIPGDSIIDRIGTAFKPFCLDVCTRKLACEIVQVLDSLNVVIAPESPKYVSKYKEMVSHLQKVAPCSKPLCVFEENSKCIAYSREDKLWKRAMIMEKTIDSSNEITVVFVDSLEISTIRERDIRMFPDNEHCMLSLKYVEVQLYGLKTNRRLRRIDVANELRNVLMPITDKAFIKIMSMESKPQIEIYAHRQMKEVVYSPLIAGGFYSKLDSIPF